MFLFILLQPFLFILIGSRLNFNVNMYLKNFSDYLRLFGASLPSRFLQIDHYLLRPERINLSPNNSQLNSK